jgi:hypothetical protein
MEHHGLTSMDQDSAAEGSCLRHKWPTKMRRNVKVEARLTGRGHSALRHSAGQGAWDHWASSNLLTETAAKDNVHALPGRLYAPDVCDQ